MSWESLGEMRLMELQEFFEEYISSQRVTKSQFRFLKAILVKIKT